MSEYLRKRFPLDSTATVRMSGKSVYNLVRHDRPGIIASVELFPADADAFRAAVSDALAEAGRAGYEAARQDMISGAFVGGPTYEALRDSFSGRKIAAEAIATLAEDIKKIHKPIDGGEHGPDECWEDVEKWPCQTIEAVRKAES